MNIQYAIYQNSVYILEANPRASRTVPLVSKVCNIRMIPIAVEIIMSQYQGKAYNWSQLTEQMIQHYGVKEAVFPFTTFPEVDPLLGPEMLSTGEVLGLADQFDEAYFKAQEAAGTPLPREGTIFLSVNDHDKPLLKDLASNFSKLGFHLVATMGTANYLAKFAIPTSKVKKLHEGHDNILTLIENGEIDLIINTTTGNQSIYDDSYIRRAAIKNKISYITTMAAATTALESILNSNTNHNMPKSLQEYHQK